MSEQQYKHLTHEDTIQAGDEFWTGSAWVEYHEDHIGKFVLVDPSRRPIANAIDQPQRERIAYEELQPGDIIQPGDEFRDADGRWHAYDASRCGCCVYGAWGGWARRPYKIGTILEIGDAVANAQKAATQLQDERDEACRKRDLARAEVATLSTELWARTPLEDRVASLTDEVTQLQAERRELIDQCNAESVRALRLSEQLSAAEVAVKSAQRARDELQLQVDELRADRERLQGLIDNLLDEPTARQVRDMLRTWTTELDWSIGCFGSFGRSQIDIIEQTMVTVINRISSMINPEGGTDDN